MMITLAVIRLIVTFFVLVLTPLQRWEALKKLNSNVTAERSFILIAVFAIVVLTVLLGFVSYNRIRQERKATNRLFVEYADTKGLTSRERQILLTIVEKTGLKRNESIFTLATAFDRGAAQMIEALQNKQGGEEAGQLRTELSFMREKLSFTARPSYSKGATTESRKLNSRQIQVGRKIHMTRRKARESGDIEATVVKNSNMELSVRLATPVKIIFGESWCVHYYFGASVWEFDTSVISYDGDILVLNHSESVRFINRRRFLRIPVRKNAFITHFPFSKESKAVWGPPEFVPAVVTELAGPGLRIESTLQVREGERVLVVVNAHEEQRGDLTAAEAGDGIFKVLEDIGEVRHIRAIPNGLSIAVELTGLSDPNVDELIRITNAASIKTGAANENAPDSINIENDIENRVNANGV